MPEKRESWRIRATRRFCRFSRVLLAIPGILFWFSCEGGLIAIDRWQFRILLFSPHFDLNF